MHPVLYYIKRVFTSMTVSTVSQARRLVRSVIGFTVLGIGIALLVLPGPAFIVIPVGLAILAGEFVWARWLLRSFNAGVRNMLKSNRKKKRNSR